MTVCRRHCGCGCCGCCACRAATPAVVGLGAPSGCSDRAYAGSVHISDGDDVGAADGVAAALPVRRKFSRGPPTLAGAVSTSGAVAALNQALAAASKLAFTEEETLGFTDYVADRVKKLYQPNGYVSTSFLLWFLDIFQAATYERHATQLQRAAAAVRVGRNCPAMEGPFGAVFYFGEDSIGPPNFAAQLRGLRVASLDFITALFNINGNHYATVIVNTRTRSVTAWDTTIAAAVCRAAADRERVAAEARNSSLAELRVDAAKKAADAEKTAALAAAASAGAAVQARAAAAKAEWNAAAAILETAESAATVLYTDSVVEAVARAFQRTIIVARNVADAVSAEQALQTGVAPGPFTIDVMPLGAPQQGSRENCGADCALLALAAAILGTEGLLPSKDATPYLNPVLEGLPPLPAVQPSVVAGVLARLAAAGGTHHVVAESLGHELQPVYYKSSFGVNMRQLVATVAVLRSKRYASLTLGTQALVGSEEAQRRTLAASILQWSLSPSGAGTAGVGAGAGPRGASGAEAPALLRDAAGGCTCSASAAHSRPCPVHPLQTDAASAAEATAASVAASSAAARAAAAAASSSAAVALQPPGAAATRSAASGAGRAGSVVARAPDGAARSCVRDLVRRRADGNYAMDTRGAVTVWGQADGKCGATAVALSKLFFDGSSEPLEHWVTRSADGTASYMAAAAATLCTKEHQRLAAYWAGLQYDTEMRYTVNGVVACRSALGVLTDFMEAADVRVWQLSEAKAPTAWRRGTGVRATGELAEDDHARYKQLLAPLADPNFHGGPLALLLAHALLSGEAVVIVHPVGSSASSSSTASNTDVSAATVYAPACDAKVRAESFDAGVEELEAVMLVETNMRSLYKWQPQGLGYGSLGFEEQLMEQPKHLEVLLTRPQAAIAAMRMKAATAAAVLAPFAHIFIEPKQAHERLLAAIRGAQHVAAGVGAGADGSTGTRSESAAAGPVEEASVSFTAAAAAARPSPDAIMSAAGRRRVSMNPQEVLQSPDDGAPVARGSTPVCTAPAAKALQSQVRFEHCVARTAGSPLHPQPPPACARCACCCLPLAPHAPPSIAHSLPPSCH